jgi:hypothetical protein
MDQLKKYLALAIKYHFWIICVVMLLTALICWWSASASLAKQFKTRKTAIDGAFASVRVEPNHPNQVVIEKVKQQEESLKKTVYVAWEMLYAEQKKNNPLPTVLSEDFKQRFENLKPKEELETRLREHYQSFIKKYLPTLQELIESRRPAGGAAQAEAAGGNKEGRDRGAERKAAVPPAPPGGRRGNPGPAAAPAAVPAEQAEVEMVGKVDWNSGDYDALVHRFDWPSETPSTLAILMAQEDLWVYEALARVVRRTNEGATSYANVPIKRINALEIGQNANKAWKAAQNAIVTLSSGPGGGSPGGNEGRAAGGGGEERNRQQLMADRYVDDKGKPLPYMPDYPYAKHPCDEFKRMPIHLNLVMDQRRLPKLLVECANSTMPIEVQQIRISNVGGEGGTAAGAAGRAQKSGEKDDLFSGDDRTIEIFGVIYIYNPPPEQPKPSGGALADNPAAAAAAAPAAAGAAPAPAAAAPRLAAPPAGGAAAPAPAATAAPAGKAAPAASPPAPVAAPGQPPKR